MAGQELHKGEAPHMRFLHSLYMVLHSSVFLSDCIIDGPFAASSFCVQSCFEHDCTDCRCSFLWSCGWYAGVGPHATTVSQEILVVMQSVPSILSCIMSCLVRASSRFPQPTTVQRDRGSPSNLVDMTHEDFYLSFGGAGPGKERRDTHLAKKTALRSLHVIRVFSMSWFRRHLNARDAGHMRGGTLRLACQCVIQQACT